MPYQEIQAVLLAVRRHRRNKREMHSKLKSVNYKERMRKNVRVSMQRKGS